MQPVNDRHHYFRPRYQTNSSREVSTRSVGKFVSSTKQLKNMRYANPLIPLSTCFGYGLHGIFGACMWLGGSGRPAGNKSETHRIHGDTFLGDGDVTSYLPTRCCRSGQWVYIRAAERAKLHSRAGAFSYEDSAGGSRARHHTRARRPLRIQQGHSTKLPPHRACSFGTGLRQVNWFR